MSSYQVNEKAKKNGVSDKAQTEFIEPFCDVLIESPHFTGDYDDATTVAVKAYRNITATMFNDPSFRDGK